MRMVRPLNSSSPQSALLLVRFFAIRGTLSVLLVLFFLTLATLLHGQAPASLSAAPIPDRILDRVSEDNLTTIHGSTHPALRRAIDMGRLPPSTEMADLVLVLTRSEAQQAALEALNKEQYDPASPLYHHWLTPDQFGAAYGVSPYDLNAITNWLQNHGFTIQEIPPSHTSIRFSGNAAQVESAFHTEMHSIQSNGVAHIANSTDIQIPAALSPVVAGVKSLHNFFPKPQHHAISRSFSQNSIALKGAAADAAPASFSGGLNQISGPKPEYSDSGYQLLVPYDMATIYNYKSLWTASTPITGTGQTIAIAGTSNIVLSDVASFRAATGLPANVPQVIVTNSDPGTTALLDDRFENTLDVEWSGGAAPGASIVLVTSSQTSQTTDALYASESYIINHNVAKIMSVSYGECELGMGTAGNQEYLNLWQQAYSQGIAVFVSSGDSAAAVCDDGNANSGTDYAAEYGTSVSGMTSTPYNVSVGGTDFAPSETGWNATNSSTNMSNATGYIAEIPWDDTVTNPWIISIYNTNYGLNYTAEQWANWFLNNEGINGYDYDGLIPPVGGSGGVSGCTTSSNGTPSSCGGGYPKPAWQAGVTGILSSDKRTVPDLSFFASSGFMGVAYLICDTQPPSFSGPIACSYPANSFDMAVGGTSVSSPVMAGVMALINQKAGAPQGNPNTALYGLAAKQNYSNCSAEKATNSSSCYFNDIDTGTIATPCFGGSVDCTPQIQSDVLGILPGYAATTGYDKATGLGSLNVANVVNGWPAASTSGPAATISPASLSFASTLVGASSAAQTVTLTNSGTNTLTISGITLTGANTAAGATISIPFTQTSTCGAALAANASCTVSVTFKPTAIGAATATLSFADNAPSATQSVTLTGNGATSGPSATLSPTSLTFASTTTGASSASQNVTLTNTGNAALTITNIALTGTNAASFARVNNCGTTVAAGAFCTVSIIFAPTASGAASATLSISDNAANAPQTVALSGIGTAPVTVSASVSPTSLTFPSTSVGTTSATQTVTFTNTGSATLSSLQAVLTGNNAALFRGASSCTGSLAAGSSCLMNFTFIPNAAGSFSATLTIQSSTAGYSAKTLTLTGTSVAAPAASFSPSSLAFPSTIVGASSATQSFTLTNTGGSALVLASIVTSGANPTSFSQTNNCGTINAGASCTITVTFKPAVAGALSASLSFKNNAANSPQTVTLTGTGLPQPTVSLTPTSLSFASTTVGASATAQTVTLKNTGTSVLTLSGISISGANSSSFTQTTTCATSLAAGASCTATVLFKPTTAGTLAASLSFADNATNSPQTVPLTGTSIAAILSATPSPLALSFPVTAVSTSGAVNYSPAQAVTFANSGNSPLTIASITLGGSNPTSFTQMNNCPSTLAPANSCTALVRFAPTATGSKTATLIFTDNASPSTQSVTLSGTGGSAPTLALSASSLSFGSITSNSGNAVQSVILTNSSTTTPLNLTSIALSGAGIGFTQLNNCGPALPASSTCTLLVQFTPTSKGTQSATLTLTSNNPSATATVALSGTGQ